MHSELTRRVVRHCSCIGVAVSLTSCAGKRPEFGQRDVVQNTNAEQGEDAGARAEETVVNPSPNTNIATNVTMGATSFSTASVAPLSPIHTSSSPPTSTTTGAAVQPHTTATTPVVPSGQPVFPASPTIAPTQSSGTTAPSATTTNPIAAEQTMAAPSGTPDCRGVTGGAATIDQCGVCDSDSGNDCTADCNGQWGGAATLDNCQVCDEDPQNDCSADCNGAPGGTATEDNCGTCDSNPNNDCVRDCKGVWGGPASEDRCGACDDNSANDCAQDCAGDWGGEATVDMCDTCDANADNDCVQDCNGLWGGSAHEDRCGVCDTNYANDCFDGESGTVETVERTRFDIGSGDIYWDMSGGQKAWLYSSGTPEITFANLTAVTDCGQVAGNGSGYTGLDSLNTLTDASALTFSAATDPILFGTTTSDCFMGLLVFHQGEYYGVLEFENIEEAGAPGATDNVLTINWWLGAPGVTNFSNIE